MANTPTPEEALERARQSQEARFTAIRELAEARQNVASERDERDRRLDEVEQQFRVSIAAAEKADAKAFSGALSAGWTSAELRKIGFAEEGKTAKARTRRQRSAAPESAPAAPAPDQSEVPQT